MKRAHNNFSIGCAAGEKIPQNHAHARVAAFLSLFPRHHAQNRAKVMRLRLHLTRHGENRFADPIVNLNLVTSRPVVLPKAFQG